MTKIIISKGVNADSRTAIDKSKEALLEDTYMHKTDVYMVMKKISLMIVEKGKTHDHTKLDYFEEFYNNYKNKNGKEFIESEWYKKHITEERHHSNIYVHGDINLLDILEEIVDKVVAGKARSGEIDLNYFNIDKNLLEKAYKNTINLIDDMTISEIEQVNKEKTNE